MQKKEDQLQRGRIDNSPIPEELCWVFHRNRLLCDEGLKSVKNCVCFIYDAAVSPTGAQLACDWCLGKHLAAPLWQEMKAVLAYVLLVTCGLQPVKGRLANSKDSNMPSQPPSFFQAICQYISYHLTVSTDDIMGIMCQFRKYLGYRFTSTPLSPVCFDSDAL